MNRLPFVRTSALALALMFVTSSFALAQTADPPAGDGTKPDNTKTNKRDRDAKAPTADQQKNNKSDVQITAEIRRAVVADKSLSMYAHNVKIIAQDGAVTLKGPVRSEAEKAAVEAKAVAVVGQAKVTNQIEIKP
jgi:hyperosmotically inducible protein